MTVSNTAGKGYANGSSNTVKYSANVDYTITFPKSLSVEKIAFYGYDNYDADAYLSQLNGVTYASTDYVFPAKVGGTATFVTHTIDLASNPATGTLGFKLGNKQCCLIVTLYGKLPTGVEKVIHVGPTDPVKWLHNGRVFIDKGGKTYDLGGKVVE